MPARDLLLHPEPLLHLLNPLLLLPLLFLPFLLLVLCLPLLPIGQLTFFRFRSKHVYPVCEHHSEELMEALSKVNEIRAGALEGELAVEISSFLFPLEYLDAP